MHEVIAAIAATSFSEEERRGKDIAETGTGFVRSEDFVATYYEYNDSIAS